MALFSQAPKQFGRRSTFQRGAIYEAGKPAMPYAVRDLSLSGARLVVASTADLPPTFRLFVEANAFQAWCTIVERSGDRVEVAFT